MSSWNRSLVSSAIAGLTLITGCAAEDEDALLNDERQEVVASMNGLRTVNGLTTLNGLRTVNGLTTLNGLRTVNGLTTLNGLRTVNGFRTVNGLEVDCSGQTAGTTCTGAPDGLLSAATGMMSTDEGINTAKYVVRCALAASDSIRIKDHTGGLVTLVGELGLAPSWKDGQCDAACQEKVSACLMALTNSSGNHVALELSAPFTLGTGNSSAFPYQEAVFYGNLFESPPKASYATGAAFQGINGGGVVGVFGASNRLCDVYWLLFGNASCPYISVGDANFNITDPLGWNSQRCTMASGAASKCKDKQGKTWNYPITTYRKTKSTT
jgi:hypothetical protein